MIEEQNKDTSELIYYCEYLSELNDKTGRNEIVEIVDFTLSDNYSVDIELNNVGDFGIDINIAIKELSEKKDNWNHGFFGEYIQNVSAIVGKNGAGKTTVLRNIYSKQPQLKYEILVLYKIDDNNFILESSSCQVCLENLQVNDKTVSLRKSAIRSGQPVEDITPVCLNIFSHNILDGWNVNYAIDDQIIALIGDTSYAATYNLIVDPTFIQLFNIQYQTLSLKLIEFEIEMNKQSLSKIVNSIKLYDVVKQAQKNNIDNIKIFTLAILLVVYKTYIIDIINSGGLKDPLLLQEGELLKLFQDYENNNANNIITLIKSLENLLNWHKPEREYREQFGSNDTVRERYHNFGTSIKVSCEKIGQYIQSIEYRNFCQIILNNNMQDNSRYLNDLEDINKYLTTKSIDFYIGNYSAGEAAIIEQIATIKAAINDGINKSEAKIEKLILDKKLVYQKDYGNFPLLVVLYIDEYENHLHPEWSRKYLSYLLKFLNIKVQSKRFDIKFQVVFTTHSPYLISDLPKENIILLDKDEEKGKRTARKSNYGFASNYYDILSDNFFLEGTIGEFARIKINGWMAELKALKDSVDLQVNNERKEQIDLSEYLPQLYEIKENFKIVDDPFIQQELISQCNSFEQYLFTLNDKEISLKQLKDHILALQKIAEDMEEDNDLP